MIAHRRVGRVALAVLGSGVLLSRGPRGHTIRA
jgi:hypothetical protein